jgi:hypothetical protein
MEPLGIALIGCGTVGSGVARLLLEQSGAWPAAPAVLSFFGGSSCAIAPSPDHAV